MTKKKLNDFQWAGIALATFLVMYGSVYVMIWWKELL